MAKSKKNDPTRCIGCPRPITQSASRRKLGEEAVEVKVGRLMPDDDDEKAPFEGKRLWGRMHLSCFNRLVGTYDLDELS